MLMNWEEACTLQRDVLDRDYDDKQKEEKSEINETIF